MSDIAVIIATRDRADWLRGTVESIRNCGDPHIIVVDDCSSDDTSQACLEMWDAKQIGTYFRHNSHQGVARAVNRGLRFAYRCGFQYMVKCDDDIVFRRDDWLDKARQAADAFPWVAYIGVPVAMIRERGHIVTVGDATVRLTKSNINGGTYIQTRQTLQTLGYRYIYPNLIETGVDAGRDHVAWYAGYEVGYLPGKEREWTQHLGSNSRLPPDVVKRKQELWDKFRKKVYPTFLRNLARDRIKLPIGYGIKEIYPRLHRGGSRADSVDYAHNRIGTNRILYVGANKVREPQLLGRFPKENVTILEPFLENVIHYRRRGYHVIQGDIRELRTKGWDLIFWWHGPEHVPRDDIPPTLAYLRKISHAVIVGCPNKWVPQEDEYGNPYERHHCHVDAELLLSCGYSVWETSDHRTGVWM